MEEHGSIANARGERRDRRRPRTRVRPLTCSGVCSSASLTFSTGETSPNTTDSFGTGAVTGVTCAGGVGQVRIKNAV